MRLVDSLLHAFHIAVISGTRGRLIGVKLIQGNKMHITELLEGLSRKSPIYAEKAA